MRVSAKSALCLVVLLYVLHRSDGQSNFDQQTTHVDIPEYLKAYVTSLVSALERKHSADIEQLTNKLNEQRDDILHLNNKLEQQKQAFDAEFAKINLALEKEKKRNAKRTTSLQNRLLNRTVFREATYSNKTTDGIKYQGRILRRQSSQSSGVAFYATMSSRSEHLGENQDIVFDHAVTNVGNAYNRHHGTFVAPTRGVYFFSVSLWNPGNMTWGHFMVNNNIIAKLGIWGYQASQFIIVTLNQGDSVSVQNTALDKSFWGDYYSTFGGFLLFESETPALIGK